MLEQQAIDSHPQLSPGDEVTIGKGVVVYEIIAAYSDGTIMLQEADTAKQRKRTVNTSSSTLVDVTLSEQTKGKRTAIDAERRQQTATQWMNSTLRSVRDKRDKSQARFQQYVDKQQLWYEYAAMALVDYQVMHEIIECIDAQITENDAEGHTEPIWETVITVATWQMSYGKGSLNGSEPTMRIRAQLIREEWVSLLTTAISVKASAENDQRRRRY